MPGIKKARANRQARLPGAMVIAAASLVLAMVNAAPLAHARQLCGPCYEYGGVPEIERYEPATNESDFLADLLRPIPAGVVAARERNRRLLSECRIKVAKEASTDVGARIWYAECDYEYLLRDEAIDMEW